MSVYSDDRAHICRQESSSPEMYLFSLITVPYIIIETLTVPPHPYIHSSLLSIRGLGILPGGQAYCILIKKRKQGIGF